MKTNKQVKNVTILLVLGMIAGINTSGQESYIKHRWNFKVGYARYKAGFKYNLQEEQTTIANYRLEANYGVLNYLETGIYLGYSGYKVSKISSDIYHTPFYGMNINFHVLPFFIKKDHFRFDAYLTGKFGGLYLTQYGYNIHKIEYALGGGLCLYPWKHFGVYTEYCYGNYLYEDAFNSNDHTKFRYGLTLKF